MISSLFMLAAVGLILGTEEGSAMTEDAARMEGVWRFDLVEVDGAMKPPPPFATNKIIILKDGRFVIMQGSLFTHGAMKIDSTKAPKQYDSTLTRGPAKGLTFPCIYELDGDTFKLCGPYRGGDRPSEFVTKPDSGLVMQVLKREKQSVEDALLDVARKELAGTWLGTSCLRDGKREADEATEKMALVFAAEGNATEIGPDGIPVAAHTKIDALVDPLRIDIGYTDGKLKGQTSLGIATIDGDTLTICRAAPGTTRPTEFSSDLQSGRTLVSYQRDGAVRK